MSEFHRLAQVVRRWELPIAPEQERAATSSVIEYGRTIAMEPEDLAIALQQYLEDWESEGRVNVHLKGAFGAALRFAPSVLASLDASVYFELHDKLHAGGGDVASLPRAVARRLLSRSSLIAHLLAEEKFSCSQVARLLSATEVSLDVPHGAIATIARAMRLLPSLDPNAAGQALWSSDESLSFELFPDSSLDESNLIAAHNVAAWLPEVDVGSLLKRISATGQTSGEPFWPYLQMLHWCLTPIEFYDHPASYLYEFAPRGRVGLDLFARYPTVTGNPVLNNAKAVQTLNSSWARNRGGDNAHGLVSLLGAIESLPFVPRRQVARVLRAWLIRLIGLCTVTPTQLALGVTDDLFDQVVSYVAVNETNTQGVIEQRIVDCLSVLAFAGPSWRTKGLGDGVNVSNFSRHKLGDVEFTNVDERRAIAVEAHAGRLSAIYARDHVRSFARVLLQRLEESWAGLDAPESWAVEVIFVAHSWDADLPTEDVVHGVRVTYQYVSFQH